jgi:hypothetical protein
MIILSFDCAIKNIGICCVEIDTEWRRKASEYIDELYALYDRIGSLSKSEFVELSFDIIKRINTFVDNIFVLRYVNVVDLIPGKKVDEVKYSILVGRLKYMLACLDKTVPKPDVVLIEHQMVINDKSRGMSRFMEEYYTPLQEPDEDITYALGDYPLINVEVKETKKSVVCIVNPTLKNTYPIDKSPAGSYSSFISKYSNYTANKKHTDHNFRYYLNKTGKMHILEELSSKSKKSKSDVIDQKTYDMADAFMMAYAWCCHNKLIDY